MSRNALLTHSESRSLGADRRDEVGSTFRSVPNFGTAANRGGCDFDVTPL